MYSVVVGQLAKHAMNAGEGVVVVTAGAAVVGGGAGGGGALDGAGNAVGCCWFSGPSPVGCWLKKKKFC